MGVTSPVMAALLPDFTETPAVTVRQVLDTATTDAPGYQYEPPPEP